LRPYSNYDHSHIAAATTLQKTWREHHSRHHQGNDHNYRSVINHINTENCTYDKKTIACAGGSLIFCAGIITMFVLLFDPQTYRVWNDGKSTIELRYRPGCSRKECTTDSDGDRTCRSVETDCKKTVYPDNHAVIIMNGHLTKLCAEKKWDFFNYHYECATHDGLQNDYNWCVENDLSFGRCNHFKKKPKSTNFTDYDWQLDGQQENVTSYLRGSSDIKNSNSFLEQYKSGSNFLDKVEK
jgi:hypothetical protein